MVSELLPDLSTFFRVFPRAVGMLSLTPGFFSPEISPRIRFLMIAGISFLVALNLGTLVALEHKTSISQVEQGLFSLADFCVGLWMGAWVRMVFTALDLAGQVISFQTNLSNASLFNPTLGSQSTLISTFLTLSGIVLLFQIRWHEHFFETLAHSYHIFPYGVFQFKGGIVATLIDALALSFTWGLKLSAPIFIIGILLQIISGFINRFLPQITIFFTAMPLNILVLLIIILSILYGIVSAFQTMFLEATERMFVSG